eukprot:COSAG02_NODE_11648_length_1681_cov_40.697851_3_plen_55_part_01
MPQTNHKTCVATRMGFEWRGMAPANSEKIEEQLWKLYIGRLPSHALLLSQHMQHL